MRRLGRLIVTGAALAAPTALGGCSHVGWGAWSSWSGSTTEGRNVRLGAFAPEDADLESTRIDGSFPAGEELMLFNVAGTVELETAAVDRIMVTGTVYADAGSPDATARLLESVGWTTFTDSGGRRWSRLEVPPEGVRRVHYPLMKDGEVTYSDRGERFEVLARPGPGVPTMFADLRVVHPPSSAVRVRTLVGHVSGGALSGTIEIDTTYGAVTVSSCDGELIADTGSGDIAVGRVDGHLSADTGAGDVTLESLVGGAFIDTGSGSIEIREADGGHLEADTGSGDVIVHRGRLASIRADTGSGDIVLHDVEFGVLLADTGSGDVDVGSPLVEARSIVADTGSGDVTIVAGQEASFRLVVDTGSGRVRVGFDDARLRRDDGAIVGATRGDARTAIHVDAGSGDVELRPR